MKTKLSHTPMQIMSVLSVLEAWDGQGGCELDTIVYETNLDRYKVLDILYDTEDMKLCRFNHKASSSQNRVWKITHQGRKEIEAFQSFGANMTPVGE